MNKQQCSPRSEGPCNSNLILNSTVCQIVSTGQDNRYVCVCGGGGGGGRGEGAGEVNGSLRQYFRLYRAVSQREEERREIQQTKEQITKYPHRHLL